MGIKKRGGFCRPPRQLYPQEERGIQRAKYRGLAERWQCALTHATKGLYYSEFFSVQPLRSLCPRWWLLVNGSITTETQRTRQVSQRTKFAPPNDGVFLLVTFMW